MKNIKPILAIVFTGLMAIGAQINIDLLLSPVPFILSDFFIILGALILGRNWGVASVMLYLLLGAIGLPVFSDGGGGVEHFAGPTGGYLAGFLVASLVIGHISEIRPQTITKDFGAWLGGILTLFSLGIAGLIFLAGMEPLAAIKAGFVPFIPAASLKGISAVFLAQAIRKLLEDKIR
ncbi:MAG: biotin transporter BioY [Bacteroidota bacterium]